jgi:pyridinium-3,5-biscarboxylic acid mononucleotide sulfurtransferase
MLHLVFIVSWFVVLNVFSFPGQKVIYQECPFQIFTIVNDIEKFKVCGTGKRELLKSKGWYPSMEIKETQDRLLKVIAGLDRLLIPYSGGVDSTLLAIFAQRALHDRARCILFDATIVPRRAIDDAAEIASKFGLFYLAA